MKRTGASIWATNPSQNCLQPGAICRQCGLIGGPWNRKRNAENRKNGKYENPRASAMFLSLSVSLQTYAALSNNTINETQRPQLCTLYWCSVSPENKTASDFRDDSTRKKGYRGLGTPTHTKGGGLGGLRHTFMPVVFAVFQRANIGRYST